MNPVRTVIASLVTCLALTLPLTAQANQLWSWSYSNTGGDSISASGTFETLGNALTPESILSITGTRNGAAITGLVPLGTDGGFSYDNKFQALAPFFNNDGVLFNVPSPVGHVNLYSVGAQLYDYTYSAIPPSSRIGAGTPVTFSVAAVPEPETYAMLLAGLGLMGFIARRRTQY